METAIAMLPGDLAGTAKYRYKYLVSTLREKYNLDFPESSELGYQYVTCALDDSWTGDAVVREIVLDYVLMEKTDYLMRYYPYLEKVQRTIESQCFQRAEDPKTDAAMYVQHYIAPIYKLKALKKHFPDGIIQIPNNKA